jgi:hypothetical protein
MSDVGRRQADVQILCLLLLVLCIPLRAHRQTNVASGGCCPSPCQRERKHVPSTFTSLFPAPPSAPHRTLRSGKVRHLWLLDLTLMSGKRWGEG